MTPKEKAKELRDNMWEAMDMKASLETTKKSVLFLIEQQLNEVKNGFSYSDYRREFWEQVKQEVNKL